MMMMMMVEWGDYHPSPWCWRLWIKWQRDSSINLLLAPSLLLFPLDNWDCWSNIEPLSWSSHRYLQASSEGQLFTLSWNILKLLLNKLVRQPSYFTCLMILPLRLADERQSMFDLQEKRYRSSADQLWGKMLQTERISTFRQNVYGETIDGKCTNFFLACICLIWVGGGVAGPNINQFLGSS